MTLNNIHNQHIIAINLWIMYHNADTAALLKRKGIYLMYCSSCLNIQHFLQ